MARASHAETNLARWWSQLVAATDRTDGSDREIRTGHPKRTDRTDRGIAAGSASLTPEVVFDDLVSRHREPQRRYHTAAHVEWVLRHVDELSGEVEVDDRAAVLAAAFFHDAVYDPRAEPGANERASAELARRQLGELGWADDRVRRVETMILATHTHVVPADQASGAVDVAVLIDADLAVLGAGSSGYTAYVNGVRAEYAHVGDADWRRGRIAVLDEFLARDTIYTTEPGRRRWEARARANLTAERAGLAA